MQKSKIALVLVMAACLGLLVSCGIAANGEIPDGAVTTAKIADGAVTSTKIADGAIVNADISGAANIDPAKISGMAWTADNDGPGSGLDADMIDGINSSALWTADNDGPGSGLDADKLDGMDSNFYWNPANDGPGSGLDADMVDGIDSSALWTATNDGPGSGLDADRLDGKDSSDFQQTALDGSVSSGGNVTITIPLNTFFTLQLSAYYPVLGGIAFVQGFDRNRYIGIVYTKYNGDGTSGYGGGEGHEATTATLLTFGSGSYSFTVECPGEATGDSNLVLTASGSLSLHYRLIY